VQRLHAALQYAQRLTAHGIGSAFTIEQRRGRLQHPNAAAQIVGRLAPAIRSLLTQGAQPLQTTFQLCDLRRSFGLAHLRVLARALADAVIDEAHKCAPCNRHRRARIGAASTNAGGPVTRGFALVLALLPAL
jgi:hypothetical protein